MRIGGARSSASSPRASAAVWTGRCWTASSATAASRRAIWRGKTAATGSLNACAARGDLPNNRLFDLAVAPCQDGVVADRLAALGLTGEETGWTRMGVEKPLGFGQESAGILDERLRRCVTTGCVAGSSKLRIC